MPAFSVEEGRRGETMAEQIMCKGKGKVAWPELVGAKGEKAKEIIERENHRVRAIILKDGSIVTMDYICERVRVWVDDDQIVVRVPHVG
ncbi:hypothetical protein AMTRI_Chr03g54120 [Amborella trichopoda]